MTDKCPVCGKGEWNQWGATVSHLACMEDGALFKELVAYKKLAEAHIDELEAELAALKGRRCKECAKFRPQHDEMPTDFCLDIGYVCFNDFACNRWEEKKGV